MPGASEGDLVTLSEQALEQALQASLNFCKLGVNLRPAVNIPINALVKVPVADIVESHRAKFEKWPGLIIDVAEEQIVSDLPLANDITKKLQHLDVRLAIDNFGRGYSSFARLKELPFAEIKLDRAFVTDCGSDKVNAPLCKTVIDLAHNFGSIAVAVGIEKASDALALVSMGCDYGQGFLLGQPMPEERFISLLRQRANPPARQGHFGEFCGHRDHVVGAAGLHDHWMALRRARNVERAEHRKMLAAMVEVVQFFRMKELPGFLVAREGIVVPGIPQSEDNAGELARPVVALAVLVMFFAAEIARLVFLARGDEIPTGAAAGEPVERSELARDVERLVVARRGGRHETDMAGVGGKRREQRQRLEIGDVLRRAAQRLHMRLPHAEIVGQEHHVEFAALRRAGDFEIVLEIDAGVGLRAGMPPRRHMVAGRIEEGAEPHLAFAGHRRIASRAQRVCRAIIAEALPVDPRCAARRKFKD